MGMTSEHNYFDVLGCNISITNLDNAFESVLDRIKSGAGGYVCFSNVHTVVTSIKDEKLRQITNRAFMAMPDGKPLSLVGRVRDKLPVAQVAGPDFMPHFFGCASGIRHYFYGSTPETLEKLVTNFSEFYPEAIIAGAYSPPFRELTSAEIENNLEDIRKSGADVIWVGLGAPKQEYWMAEHWQQLKPAVLLGVGAAFDFHAGLKTRAPLWMKKYSLEWLHRFCNEPGRLWKRYLVTNTKFILYLLSDTVIRRMK